MIGWLGYGYLDDLPQEPVGLRKNLLRRWEIGLPISDHNDENHPWFSPYGSLRDPIPLPAELSLNRTTIR
ncbi:MAG: hypothetical protein ACRERS_05165, partial [Methylococcales bacterium]